jgi:hypothetical protein
MRFKRECVNCGKMFQPNGKYGRYCDECRRIKLIKSRKLEQEKEWKKIMNHK